MQAFALPFGAAHVFYPEATRGALHGGAAARRRPGRAGARRGAARARSRSTQYVNDRPYVASSFLSVAHRAGLRHARWRAAARSGRSWPSSRIPLEARLAGRSRAAAARSSLRRLFEPLGYAVDARSDPLDERSRSGATSRYLTRHAARRRCGCATCSTHLYVLLPVLDDDKHYWVGDDEVEKLLRRGEGWLAGASRARADRRAATSSTSAPLDARRARAAARRRGRRRRRRGRGARAAEEEAVEEPLRPATSSGSAPSSRRCRRAARARARPRLRRRASCCARCSTSRRSSEIVGVDVSYRALEIAARRLRLDRMPPRQRERIELLQGALTYRDQRLRGLRRGRVVEVIEHLDPPRLAALRARRVRARAAADGRRDDAERRVQRDVRDAARPGSSATATTASSGRAPSSRRGPSGVAERHGYAVRFLPVGPEDPERRRADADGGVHADERRDRRSPSCRLVVLVGAVRLGQVDVRAHALPADRGRLVGLLPRAGRRRRERPGRDRRTRSTSCTSSPASGWRRAG